MWKYVQKDRRAQDRPDEDYEDVVIQHHQVVVEKEPLAMKLKRPPRSKRCNKISFGL